MNRSDMFIFFLNNIVMYMNAISDIYITILFNLKLHLIIEWKLGRNASGDYPRG